LLQIAQAEARADGRPISLRADAKGFRFNRRSDDGLGVEAFQGDAQLRPRLWESTPMQLTVEPRQTLVLNAEWINPPLRVVLSDGQHSLSLQRDAAGLLRVVSQP
jgi:general secretion pathway protein H